MSSRDLLHTYLSRRPARSLSSSHAREAQRLGCTERQLPGGGARHQRLVQPTQGSSMSQLCRRPAGPCAVGPRAGTTATARLPWCMALVQQERGACSAGLRSSAAPCSADNGSRICAARQAWQRDRLDAQEAQLAGCWEAGPGMASRQHGLKVWPDQQAAGILIVVLCDALVFSAAAALSAGAHQQQ